MKKIWLSILLFMITPQLWAGLNLNPLQLYISDEKQQRSTTLTLASKNVTEAKIFEVTAKKWSQNEKGEEVLEPDPSVILNPKNFVLKPNSKQVVRVGFSQMPNLGEKEETWRLFFTEVPPAVRKNGVTILINMSVPLFVGKQSPADLKITPKFENDSLLVKIKNNADSHIKLFAISLVDGDKGKEKEISNIQVLKYLLKKSEYDFKFPQIKSKNIENYRILIETDKGEKPLEFKLKE